MSRFHVWGIVTILAGVSSPVWAQGLYGAPEMVRLHPGAVQSGSPNAPLGSSSGYGPVQSQYQAPAQPASRPYSRTAAVASRPGWSGTAPGQSTSAFAGNDDSGHAGRTMATISPGAASVSNGTLGSMSPDASSPQPTPYPGIASGAGCGGPGCGDSCSGPVGGFEDPQCYQPMWYVSGNGLMMTRANANGVATTYKTGNFPNHMLMQTTDAEVDWRGGYEGKVGVRFGPGRHWAIEGGWWAVDGFQGGDGFAASSLVPANTLSTPLVVNGIEFGGTGGDYFFNTASEHRLWRKNQVQNAEVSLVCWSGGDTPGSCSPFDIALIAGPRYFVFEEELGFGSLANGGSWGGRGGLDEAYLQERIRNTLIGGQIGFDAGCHLGSMFRVYFAPKFGIYNNHIVGDFLAVRGDGTAATPTAASGVTGSYPVRADKDVFSCLTQIDTGVEWRFHPRWSAFIGYRLVVATGIGLADHQIPADTVDIPALSTVKHNGDLLLHGGVAGLAVQF